MRKVLFVGFASEQAYTGGCQCSKRNYQSLETLFGQNNVGKYIIEPYKNRRSVFTILERVRDIFRGYMGGLKRSREKEILHLLKTEFYTDLFVDSSLLGILVPKVKRQLPHIRIYTFFHNFEYAFIKDSIMVNKDYIRFYWFVLTFLNEKSACKYSNKIISLNERDTIAIRKMYGKEVHIQIPITLSTSYYPTEIVKHQKASSIKTALFIGSYFFGNVQGLKWFCKNVLPLTDIRLIIVGSGMEKLNCEIDKSERIRIYSNVPDLTPYYENADFVVLPILSGSGMKVKTAEALMYGKYIIGTSEALRGYAIDDSVAIKCDTAGDFVQAITSYNNPTKFNKYSRLLFEEKYSFEVSLQLFNKVLEV